MTDLEKYLHSNEHHRSPLLKAARAHVQFETIHPFLDGNGRTGRLLIALILADSKILSQPLLYLSLFFKTHRQECYRLLDVVRHQGDWEAWLAFFAEAVEVTAGQAVSTARRLSDLMAQHRSLISSMGRAAGSAGSVLDTLCAIPVAGVDLIEEHTGLSRQTVYSALQRLVESGLVHEMTGGKRHRIYAYTDYLAILNEETELPR